MLKRPVLDIRSTGRTDARFDERDEVEENLIVALRRAITFVAQHVGIEDAAGLERAEGSADYIAMREALVNLLIHQDYRDPSAAGQITLVPDGMTVFNPGHSLVSPERLSDGYRSQSRNPLIARAFRLIRYAELGGTGLMSLQRAWRQAHRKPPRFNSSEKNNTFSLDLSWKKLPVVADPRWLDRLGVAISTETSRALELLLQAGAVTTQEVASGTGLPAEDASHVLRTLLVQALAIESDGTWRASESALRVWTSSP
jgi:predicted HTH transcriptional regulator